MQGRGLRFVAQPSLLGITDHLLPERKLYVFGIGRAEPALLLAFKGSASDFIFSLRRQIPETLESFSRGLTQNGRRYQSQLF